MTNLKFPIFSMTISQKIGHSIANAIDNNNSVKFTTYLRNSVPQIIVLTPPFPSEIITIINSLNPNTASGYNNISSFFLHLGDDVIAPKFGILITNF